MLAAAAALFAERGYLGVSIDDLGAAVGVSGPALYRHFPGKAGVLAAILIDASRALLEGGERVAAGASDPERTLAELVEFHVAFASENPDVILVQDRELDQLDPADRHEVRSMQRRYVELWVEVLRPMHPGIDTVNLRTRAHAAFGLMNSTPYAAPRGTHADVRALRELLGRMARAALTAPGSEYPMR
ncbi:MAG TPA: TetR/AcrR family transcriptional regulator [Candidatus Lumbricidophila sp.]|nr:TetR/AcrR family transcriptional regulator [Candidatus Lumbricidophila sp.]